MTRLCTCTILSLDMQKQKANMFSKKSLLENNDHLLTDIAHMLSIRLEKEQDKKKYTPVKTVLKMIGVGVFLSAALVAPNVSQLAKSFLRNDEEYEIWKRFNIPYLKRTLNRLEQQKLVEIGEKDGKQTVTLTENGKKKILQYAIDELVIEKPKNWDKTWRLVSYDIPVEMRQIQHIFREYLKTWGFYLFHESVLLHAYPCEKQIEFLREYLGIGQYVRIFTVTKIENDTQFRTFFGV